MGTVSDRHIGVLEQAEIHQQAGIVQQMAAFFNRLAFLQHAALGTGGLKQVLIRQNRCPRN